MKITQIVLATGLVGHAAATWNMYSNPFKSPNYNDNECSDKQKGGFDWSDLKDGDSNFNYGDFDFTGGWKCSNSFGKRDHLTRRTFGSKCIKNKVSKEKPASFGCNKRKSGFSITHIDVSVEYDVDLELHYQMEDGSKCKQIAPCKSSGSTIQNTQCGGAKSVDVYLPKHDKSDKECEIGFHNIGFDCNPGKGYNPPSPPEIPASSAPVSSAPATEISSTPEASVPTPPATEYPVTSAYEESSSATEYPATSVHEESSSATEYPATSAYEESSSTTEYPATSVHEESSSATEYPATSAYEESSSATEYPATSVHEESSSATEYPATSAYEVSSSAAEYPVSSAPEVSSSATEYPATSAYEVSSAPGTTAPVETPVTFSTAPFTNSSAPATTAPPTYETSPVAQPPVSESASAPACNGKYGESCEETTAVSTPVASSTVIVSTGVPQPSSPSYPPVSPPDVLPKCMNTWLEVSGDCKNNADASCYCKNKDFTKSVIECVTAWCGTDDETREALQYLIGICAEHVPENPGLVTDCPSYIPLNPTPASPTAPAGGVSTPAGEVGSSTVAYGTTPAPEVPGTTPAPEVPGTTPAPEVPGTAPASEVSGTAPGYEAPGTAPGYEAPGTAPGYEAPGTAPAYEAPGTTPAPEAPGAPSVPEVPYGSVTGKGPAETPVAYVPHTTIVYGTTTLTIPQVHFTTQTDVAGATATAPVGLYPGTAPAQAPASTTAASYPTGVPYPIAGTTLATFKPTGTGAYSPTSPAEFTGAAAPFKVEAQHAVLGAMLAFFVL